MKTQSLIAFFAATLAAAPALADGGRSYLALGDSIAFGFSPLIDYTKANVDGGMFVGYPESVAAADALALSSAACSGETSGSFIDASQPDNGCNTGEHHKSALKVSYSGSQLDYAVGYLRAHPDTQLVTITIGGNDLLLVQDACAKEAIPTLCEVVRTPGTLATFAANLTRIFFTLRATGYTGQIVAVTQYATNYSDAVQTLAVGSFKNEVAAVAALFCVTVAHGYEAFEAAAKPFGGDACKAGLLIRMPDGTCNEHPSPKGRELLADAVLAVLN